MMRLEERERHLESEVVSRQQRVLHIDQKRQASVNDINQQIAHLVNVLEKQAGAESKTSPWVFQFWDTDVLVIETLSY